MSRKKNRRKNGGPSPAELARREAQSTQDTEGPQTITVYGVDVTIDPAVFRDIEVTGWTIIMGDDSAPGAAKFQAAMQLVMRICGDQWKAVIAGMRAEHGNADIDHLIELVEMIMGPFRREAS